MKVNKNILLRTIQYVPKRLIPRLTKKEQKSMVRLGLYLFPSSHILPINPFYKEFSHTKIGSEGRHILGILNAKRARQEVLNIKRDLLSRNKMDYAFIFDYGVLMAEADSKEEAKKKMEDLLIEKFHYSKEMAHYEIDLSRIFEYNKEDFLEYGVIQLPDPLGLLVLEPSREKAKDMAIRYIMEKEGYSRKEAEKMVKEKDIIGGLPRRSI